MAIKKKKNTNPSKYPQENSKVRPVVLDLYPDLVFNREMPVTEAFIDRLAQDMIEFAEKEDTLTKWKFIRHKKIAKSNIQRWCKNFPQLQRAWDHMVDCIASRREEGAIMRKYDGGFVREFHAMYDQEYKDFLLWKYSLNKKPEDGATSGTFILRMQNAPLTDEVPERKKEE